ncbi:3-hydroxy-3-methylglutaryl-coenzyme A (HMG-CoA) reductase isozyme [Agyrium rufum]|nr:3-hydroxy-3-methylglutaryl-coenzyme A (HMG-CoA) reductase isozyme [Agyrium rufum]
MLFSTLFRRSEAPNASTSPRYLNRKVSLVLQAFSKRACTHPIHTIVFIALLASTSYIGLLEGSLSGPATPPNGSSTTIDLAPLVEGGRKLFVGDSTGWKWQVARSSPDEKAKHLALVTLVFPKSLHSDSPQTAPLPNALPIPTNTSADSIPSTSNPFSPFSQDKTLAFSMPFDQAQYFLNNLQEIPEQADAKSDESRAGRTWVAKPLQSGSNGSRSNLRSWANNSWTKLVDLLKHAETLDIIIMVLGYLSMHLTFVSLFISMKRMGSNFWLAFTVLLSSSIAFLFGVITTTRLGVPINMVLLSEGLPFLVVTIGFEKPIMLTKAVLSASLDSRRLESQSSPGSPASNPGSPKSIQYAVQIAVGQKGFDIVRDYVVEIAILIAGAASGVQGGLKPFCFLAAWILFFDCIMLFTFYTSILSIKLEINRIKRHVALRRALEEDGLSRRVAETVASNTEWPRLDSQSNDRANLENPGVAIFGKKVGESSVPKFKILMVGGFVFINIINLCTIPFRSGNKNASATTVAGLSSVLSSPPMDPFKVAENGLSYIWEAARKSSSATLVTVLQPIKYDLISPYSQGEGDEMGSIFDLDYSDQIPYAFGGKVIEGVLKSLEDPVLSKWIIVALTLSVILNGYLFNAARWSIKEIRSNPDSVNRNLAPVDDQIGREPPTYHNGQVPEVVEDKTSFSEPTPARSRSDCEQMLREKRAAELTDPELNDLACHGLIPGYALEKTLENKNVMSRLASLTRAVKIRRALVSRTPATKRTTALLEHSKLPYEHYNYENVHGACCENVIGYLPLPLGVAGPLIIDGQSYFLPMATTEGVLVASTNRGCKAINAGGGAITVLTGDGMTRGPCVGFPTLSRAGAAKNWLDSPEGQATMKKAFNSTSRFARLQSMKTAIAGTYLYIRFKTTTGDAMGMNMISKGVECALNVMMDESGFDDMSIISVSGNYCTDKKPAAINWIDGRGKSIVAEAIIPAEVVKNTLKSDVDTLVELNIAKNLIGSSLAGTMGGNNAHAANIVAAIFLATGQDPAQVVESANCMTLMRNCNGNLQISVSMPCIEVGTIGGGTVLDAQGAMLDLLGVRGAHLTDPGANARQLARIIGAATLAGELSLCGALAAGHLVSAHMKHNRSAAPTRSATPVSSAVASAPSFGQMRELAPLARIN